MHREFCNQIFGDPFREVPARNVSEAAAHGFSVADATNTFLSSALFSAPMLVLLPNSSEPLVEPYPDSPIPLT